MRHPGCGNRPAISGLNLWRPRRPLVLLPLPLQRAYVAAMLQFLGRALPAASRTDEVLRHELAALPAGLRIQIALPAGGSRVTLQSQGEGLLRRVHSAAGDAELTIRFKHLTHAFLMLSCQEGTVQAFANNRMVADGDLGTATRLVRCLDRLQTLILPGCLARRAVRRYQPPPAAARLRLALRIYAGVAASFLGRS